MEFNISTTVLLFIYLFAHDRPRVAYTHARVHPFIYLFICNAIVPGYAFMHPFMDGTIYLFYVK